MSERTKDLLLLGGIIVSAIALAVFMANVTSTKSKACKDKGGIMIKASDGYGMRQIRTLIRFKRLFKSNKPVTAGEDVADSLVIGIILVLLCWMVFS